MQPLLTVSIVSHQQAPLVMQLVGDLARAAIPVEIVVTVNTPETLPFNLGSGGAHPLRLIENAAPKGFATNHNRALAQSRADFFCVLNPDLRLSTDPFPALLEGLKDPTLGVIAPRVIAPDGQLEDSARAFPSPITILSKVLGATHSANVAERGMSYPDWVAGMFMMFPRAVFQQMGGFDERYFLYYEDVDICARLRRAGYRVAYCADATVIHNARRQSRRNLRYMRWHFSSMMRFLVKRAFHIV